DRDGVARRRSAQNTASVRLRSVVPCGEVGPVAGRNGTILARGAPLAPRASFNGVPSAVPQRGHSRTGRLGLRQGAELLHHAERVEARPALSDLATRYAVDRDP